MYFVRRRNTTFTNFVVDLENLIQKKEDDKK